MIKEPLKKVIAMNQGVVFEMVLETFRNLLSYVDQLNKVEFIFKPFHVNILFPNNLKTSEK